MEEVDIWTRYGKENIPNYRRLYTNTYYRVFETILLLNLDRCLDLG